MSSITAHGAPVKPPLHDRILGVQPEGIPAELKERPQWVCWRGKLKADGHINKPPSRPDGQGASHSDPADWSSFARVRAAYDHGGFDGVGYVFSAGDPYTGVDLDRCRDPETGDLAPWAQEIVRLLDSYTEVSPSKTGVKIFVRGTIPGPRHRTAGLEMYGHERFFTTTGARLQGTPPGVEERQEQLDQLYQQTFPEHAPEPERTADTPPPVWAIRSDDDIISRAKRAKNEDKFTQLHSGDNTGYASTSDGDLAYCSLLAFWTQDAAQIARLWRASGRSRKKLERQSYVEGTIGKALAAPGARWAGPSAFARATTTGAEEPGAEPGESGDEPSPQGTEPRSDGGKPDAPETLYCTDMGNAQRLITRYGDDLRYCYAQGRWYVWAGTHWGHDEGGAVVRMAKSTARAIYHEAAAAPDPAEGKAIAKWAFTSQSDTRLAAMIHLAQSEAPISPAEFDKNPLLLNVQNGTINLETGECQKQRPEDMLTNMAPIRYDKGATCPQFLSFLGHIMAGNQAMIDFLQRAAGYNLTASVSEQKLVIAYGSGANGKSTLFATLLSLMGDYAKQAAPDLLLAKKGESHPTELADLLGCRFVASIEVDEGRRMAESQIKQLTGGDRMKARHMRQDFFEFEPTHKLWLAVNHRPVVRGTDHAMWRRIALVPFTVTIPDDRKDKDLPAKLRTELPGILNWAIVGCLAWQHGGLQAPDEVKDATKEYRGEMDVLAHWLDDCCVIHPDARAAAGDLYTSYAEWCGKGGEYPLPQRTFGLRLAERGYEQKKSGSIRSWKGLGLLAPQPPEGGDEQPTPGQEQECGTHVPRGVPVKLKSAE